MAPGLSQIKVVAIDLDTLLQVGVEEIVLNVRNAFSRAKDAGVVSEDKSLP